MHETNDARQRCLSVINDILAEYRLPPWTDGHLGDPAEGQCEIVDFVDMAPLAPRRVAITVRMRDPLGQEREVSIRFGGAVVYVVPLLNLLDGEDAGSGPMLCLSKRWRIEHGDWSLELPHALVAEDDLGDPEHPLASRAHRAFAATFGEVAVESISAAKVVPLGAFKVRGEARPAEAYILASTVMKPFVRRKGDGSLVKLAWSGAPAILDGGKHITEPVTVATLYRALRKFPALKKTKIETDVHDGPPETDR